VRMARVTRAEFAAASRTLIAKVPDLHNRGYFAKTDFQIDLEAGTCTCPNQQRAVKGGGGTFVFAPEICAACPRRAPMYGRPGWTDVGSYATTTSGETPGVETVAALVGGRTHSQRRCQPQFTVAGSVSSVLTG